MENGISAKLSHNTGTSFCNRLYGGGLKYIADNSLSAEMVFVHVVVLEQAGYMVTA